MAMELSELYARTSNANDSEADTKIVAAIDGLPRDAVVGIAVCTFAALTDNLVSLLKVLRDSDTHNEWAEETTEQLRRSVHLLAALGLMADEDVTCLLAYGNAEQVEKFQEYLRITAEARGTETVLGIGTADV